MEESPYVSIVVPAFNDKDGLERLLPSLLEQVYPLYRYEIIIITLHFHFSNNDERFQQPVS